MKLAVILVGNVRTWDQCKKNYKELFEKDEKKKPDLFVSTYTRKFNYHPYIQNLTSSFDDFILNKKEVVEMFDGLNVRDIQVEESEYVDDLILKESQKFHDSMKNIDSCYAQYRKLKLGLNMVKNYETMYNFKYDYIIKTRCDIIHNKFKFVDNKEDILIDSGNVFPNDCFFMTNRDSMFEMSEFMYNEFYDPIFENSNNSPPHGLLLNAITNSKLNVKSEKIMKHVVRRTMTQAY